MPRVEAVAFDFNGVLADSDGVYEKVQRQAIEWVSDDTGRYDSDDIPDWAYAAAANIQVPPGYSTSRVRIRFALEAGDITASEETVEEVHRLKSDLYLYEARKGLPAVNGAVDLVQWFREKLEPGKLVIASRADEQREIAPFIERYGLAETFGAVLGAQSTPRDRGKPDPYVYNAAIERLRIDRESTLAVEDSEKGAKAATAAGLICATLIESRSPGVFLAVNSIAGLRSHLSERRGKVLIHR